MSEIDFDRFSKPGLFSEALRIQQAEFSNEVSALTGEPFRQLDLENDSCLNQEEVKFRDIKRVIPNFKVGKESGGATLYDL